MSAPHRTILFAAALLATAGAAGAADGQGATPTPEARKDGGPSTSGTSTSGTSTTSVGAGGLTGTGAVKDGARTGDGAVQTGGPKPPSAPASGTAR